nr:MAG TPA: hypothetical protein [Caudoviricetes sp.]
MKTKKIRKRTIPKTVKTGEEKGLEFYLKKGQIKLLMSYIKSGSSNILILGNQKQVSRFLYQFFETISEEPEKIFSEKIENKFFAWKTISIYEDLYFPSMMDLAEISTSDFEDLASCLAFMKRLSPEIIVTENLENKKNMELSYYLRMINSARKFGIAPFENIEDDVETIMKLGMSSSFKEVLSTFNIIINLNERAKYRRVKKIKIENPEKDIFSVEPLFC